MQSGIREVELRALYVHCSAHCLSLCVQDSLKEIQEVDKVIGTTKNIMNFIKESPKRLGEFKDIKSAETPLLTSFCPKRFVIGIFFYI